MEWQVLMVSGLHMQQPASGYQGLSRHACYRQHLQKERGPKRCVADRIAGSSSELFTCTAYVITPSDRAEPIASTWSWRTSAPDCPQNRNPSATEDLLGRDTCK